MPPPEIAKLLHDIRQATERISRFVAGKTVDDYVNDDFLRSAVERQFSIIGEAMVRLIKKHREIAEQITEYRKIASFRHVLVHGYDSIDDYTSWGIIQQKLPILLKDIQNLLTP